MKEYTIYPLVVGANETDQGVMTYLRGYGKRVWIPIYVFFVDGGDEKILIDTGLEQFVVPPHVGEEYGLEILEFEEALATVGMRPEDVDIIVHTHLHNDHCENDYKCPQAKIVVQKREYEFFQNPHPIDHRYYGDLLDGLQVETVDGDVALREGIDLLLTPGHTPGGQSIVVNTAAGRVVVTGFCCNDMNFPPDGHVVTPGVHIDAIAAYESARKVREIADVIIPLHSLTAGRQKRIPA